VNEIRHPFASIIVRLKLQFYTLANHNKSFCGVILLHALNIRSVARKPKICKKLEEIGTYHKYPNLLNRGFAATRPNQKWVTDVTYILVQQGWAYLSTIKDLYDGCVVGHVFSQNNSIALVTATLRRAKSKEKLTDGLILHSDHIVPMSFGRGTNTLHRHIMMSLPRSIKLPLPCLDAATVGTMHLWRTSLDISKKSISVNSRSQPLKKLSN
jgi:hypothetical protein